MCVFSQLGRGSSEEHPYSGSDRFPVVPLVCPTSIRWMPYLFSPDVPGKTAVNGAKTGSSDRRRMRLQNT